MWVYNKFLKDEKASSSVVNAGKFKLCLDRPNKFGGPNTLKKED